MQQLKITQLYHDLSQTIAGEYLAKYEYPWEVFPHIGEIILELGKQSRTLHRLTGEYVGASGADLLYCCGNEAKYYVDGAVKKGMPQECCHYFESKQDMINALKNELKEGDAVLFKASRGMKLEEAVNALE